jgi:hypothetical protein
MKHHLRGGHDPVASSATVATIALTWSSWEEAQREASRYPRLSSPALGATELGDAFDQRQKAESRDALAVFNVARPGLEPEHHDFSSHRRL